MPKFRALFDGVPPFANLPQFPVSLFTSCHDPNYDFDHINVNSYIKLIKEIPNWRLGRERQKQSLA